MFLHKKIHIDKCSEDCYKVIKSHGEKPILTPKEDELVQQLFKSCNPDPCLIYLFLKYTYDTKYTCAQLSQLSYPSSKILKKQKPKFCNKKRTQNFYIQCAHEGSCKDAHCSCHESNTFCELTCLCEKCDNLFEPCRCNKCDEKCKCFISFRECTPLCHPDCKNRSMHFQKEKETYIAASKISGFGLFAGEDILKNEFVIEYIGELVSDEEAERRGYFYDHRKLSYLFDLKGTRADHRFQTLDSTRIGNKSKYINNEEDTDANLMARQMLVNGIMKIGMFSIRNIKKDEELYFNYHYNNEQKAKFGIKVVENKAELNQQQIVKGKKMNNN